MNQTRLHWVDLLRGIAIVEMIFGHTIGALLLPAAQKGAVFEAWTWCRGLTAPAFLLASGASFYLSSVEHRNEHLSQPDKIRSRFLRGLQLIILGYAMHAFVPAWLSGDLNTAFKQAFIMDILPCTGIWLMIAEAFLILTRRFRDSNVMMGYAMLCLSVWLVSWGVERGLGFTPETFIFWPLAHAITAQHGSLFPLFPWGEYFLAGIWFAYLSRTMRPTRHLSPDVSWLFSKRLTVLFALALALQLLSKAIPLRIMHVVKAFSKDSLWFYIVHLQLLYLYPLGWIHHWANALPLSVCLCLSALNLGLCWMFLRLWVKLRPRFAKQVQWLLP